MSATSGEAAIIPVILCGGSGTRLWPLSRSEYPKQFIEEDGSNLFSETVRRALAVPGCREPLVVCNESQRFLAAASLQRMDVQAGILLEHKGRNTAPAIALAAFAALERQGEDACLLVLPSDHLIRPLEAFVAAINEGLPAAAAGKLVTFGIVPDSPATGYGYILHGKPLAQGCEVQAFTEKPSRDKAEAMLTAGGCSWNSGIFLFKASVFLKELEAFRPDILAAVRKMWNSRSQDMDFTRFGQDLCEACPADSIDYAVMEKTDLAVVVPLRAQWSDLGSWEAMYQAADKDEQQNAVSGDVMLDDVTSSYIRSGGRLVAAVGVKNLVVVESPDAVLIADKSRSQDVKNILQRLQAEGREEAKSHVKVYRPWGNYQSLARGDRFQVKRIEVNPGASLSLQYHHHRAEHWVVVNGTARITKGEEVLILTEDESTYIPLGTVHRLDNPGRIPLVIMEIQTGSYLGEDDIVRLEDNYGRLPSPSQPENPVDKA